jgi:hypothetical protein
MGTKKAPRGAGHPWCSGRDLNPDTLRHMHLKHACLPFHHLSEHKEVGRWKAARQAQVKSVFPTLANRP